MSSKQNHVELEDDEEQDVWRLNLLDCYWDSPKQDYEDEKEKDVWRVNLLDYYWDSPKQDHEGLEEDEEQDV